MNRQGSTVTVSQNGQSVILHQTMLNILFKVRYNIPYEYIYNPTPKDTNNSDSLDGRTEFKITSEPEWAMRKPRSKDAKYSNQSEGTTFHTAGSKIPTEFKILEDDHSQQEWPAQCNTIVHYPDSSCLSSHNISRSTSPLPITYTTNTLTQSVPSRMAGRKYSLKLYKIMTIISIT